MGRAGKNLIYNTLATFKAKMETAKNINKLAERLSKRHGFGGREANVQAAGKMTSLMKKGKYNEARAYARQSK